MRKHLTYFIADVHLGVYNIDPIYQDRRFADFIEGLPTETESIYLLGDIFDFWYEYRRVIPKGHTRSLGALAKRVDSGTAVYFMRGNHDIWCYDYFESEIGMTVINRQPYVTRIGDRTFCLGHGDGLCDDTLGFRFIRAIFHSKAAQRAFNLIHPNMAFDFGYKWASHSRKIKEDPEGKYVFKGMDSPICRFADEFGKDKNIDYYIFGHFHTPGDIDIPSGGHLFILGEWVKMPSCVVFDGDRCNVQNFL